MMKITFLLCTSWVTSGFVVVKPTTTPTRLLKPLAAVGVVIETEEDARFILSKAKECAYGDSCDVEDCELFLNEMLHLQSGCVTGTLIGDDLCEDQDVAADVVAHLREKVKDRIKAVAKRYVVKNSCARFLP
jgi:hypothetical protein